jgi:Holliday junction resolvasome RuvABC ATP-dependent DNA helicase subunit
MQDPKISRKPATITLAEPQSESPTPKIDRPLARTLEEVTGQSEVVRRLKALVELSRRRGSVLGHLLFVGPEGCGKRTMAHVIARELGVNLRGTSGWAIERVGDLAAIINDLEKGDVLLIENVDRLRKEIAGVLVPALSDFELNIIVGKGSGMRFMRLAVKPFTLIGSVERESDCSRDLLNTFHGRFSFQRYTQPEMLEITNRLANLNGVATEPAAAALVSKLSDGSPARAESLLRRLELVEKRPVGEQEAREMLSLFGFGNSSPISTLGGVTKEWSELSGIEFEQLIAALLTKMGFATEMTKASGDGGIDVEAFLDKPIVGGRYLIQCKRFAPDALVGSPTVREFYGALVADRKAVKGILITTSGFTPQAHDFAANLPIELIDGATLSDLLKELPPSP